ncbi:MAG: prenyltransferase [Candidatus Saccharimonadales bacterium]
MVNKLLKLFKVSRPISWINTAYPFLAAYLVVGGQIDLVFILGSIFFFIPYNILMYGINDVFDYESDVQNPRKGTIEGAVESKQFHPYIIKASLISTIPFVIALAFLIPWYATLTLLVVLFFVVAYSVKGLRFKEIPVLDSITSSMHFIGPLLVALAIFDWPSQAWPIVIAFFLWGMASHAFGAVQDIIPDRKGKLKSIATVLGARITVGFSFLLYIVSSMIISINGNEIFIGIVGLLYALNVLPYLHVSDKTSATTNKGWRRFIWINYIVGAVITLTLLFV